MASPDFVEETDDKSSFDKAKWHRDRKDTIGNMNLAQSHANTGQLKIQLRAQERKKTALAAGQNFAFR